MTNGEICGLDEGPCFMDSDCFGNLICQPDQCSDDSSDCKTCKEPFECNGINPR